MSKREIDINKFVNTIIQRLDEKVNECGKLDERDISFLDNILNKIVDKEKITLDNRKKIKAFKNSYYAAQKHTYPDRKNKNIKP